MFYKKALFVFLGCFGLMLTRVISQDQKIADSLALIYQQSPLADTTKLIMLRDLSFNEMRDLNKGLKYAEELVSLSKKGGNEKYLFTGYFLVGTKRRLLGNLDQALEAYIKSVEIARQLHYIKGEGEAYGAIADIYSVASNYPNALQYYQKAIITLRQPEGDSISLATVLSNAGDAFLKSKTYDSALLYFREAKVIFDRYHYLSGIGYSLGNIGMVYANVGENYLAEKNINEAINILEETQDYYPICVYLTSMADIYLNKGDKQAALNYILKSHHLAEQYGLREQVSDASLKLSEFYETAGNLPEAFKFYKKHIAYRDSINNIHNVQKMADLRTDYEVSQKQAEVNLLQQQKRTERKLSFSLGIILVLTVIILGVLIKNNKNRQKAYKVLNIQKLKTEEQKAKAEAALNELQVTQNQLIHSAKMASLGELTAGIAHEIQNPLNFVNNFSEVSFEMLDELREETVHKLSSADKAAAEEIINVLEENLKKINDHGKRADAIVKGMLQHSKSSTGKKEPTDINALADEYLRLSYHGIRAKDREFKASLKSDFDGNIGLVEVVPQEIGRVLLNFYNNAFYSVNKRKKQENGDFEPAVLVSTKRIGNKVEISVKDNGLGIPQNATEKIFQPFFTTKPTGEGTGLGLSLSYDIIKAHGGDLKVESKEGEFAEFTILLPAGNNYVA